MREEVNDGNFLEKRKKRVKVKIIFQKIPKFIFIFNNLVYRRIN